MGDSPSSIDARWHAGKSGWPVATGWGSSGRGAYPKYGVQSGVREDERLTVDGS
jgi:hypothetical protein